MEKEKQDYLQRVREASWLIEFIPDHLKTEEVCFEAAKSNGYLLKFVPEPMKTYTLCSIAVENNPSSLEFVPPQFKSGDPPTFKKTP